MNFDPSEEQAMIRDSAERAVREYCELGRRRERIGRDEGFDSGFWTQFADLGWLALCLPEEEGGIGGSMTDMALLLIELGRGAAGEPIVSSAVVCGRLLAEATWPPRAPWCEKIVAGEARLAFAGPSRGGAEPVRLAGDVLSGAAPVVFDAEGADGFVVAAESADGPVLVLVPADAAGLGISGYPLFDGTRAADLSFSGVAVPEDAVIARGQVAADLIADAVAREKLMCCAAAVGSMEACLALSADYAATRAQFGQPIGKFQSIQHLMADMLVAAHNARSMLYFALSRWDGDRAARGAAVALAGKAIGEAALAVSRGGIQIHGGYGMTDEFAIGHHHRYLFVLDKRIAGR